MNHFLMIILFNNLKISLIINFFNFFLKMKNSLFFNLHYQNVILLLLIIFINYSI